MTTVAMTGHRPERISNPDEVRAYIMIGLKTIAPDILIQGMASGVDLWSAKIADSVGLPFWSARPWAGHKPRKADEKLYAGAIKYAQIVHNVSPLENYPGPWIYQRRNEWMVDRADVVFAVWDGGGGGTYNCIEYAIKKGKKICRLDPIELHLEWL